MGGQSGAVSDYFMNEHYPLDSHIGRREQTLVGEALEEERKRETDEDN